MIVVLRLIATLVAKSEYLAVKARNKQGFPTRMVYLKRGSPTSPRVQ